MTREKDDGNMESLYTEVKSSHRPEIHSMAKARSLMVR